MNEEIIDKKQLKERILSATETVIYGAGVVAYGAYVALKCNYGISPKMFVVSKDMQCDIIDGVEVKPIDQVCCENEKVLFIVATPEIYHADIKVKLTEKNIMNVLYVNSHIEFLLMSEYYANEKKFEVLGSDKLSEYELKIKLDEDDVKIFMCCSDFDKQLQTTVVLEKFVQPIHVGRALSTSEIAKVTDDIGENISYKNRNYSELTATYWIWKNIQSRYKGICHYRRQLMLTETDMCYCIENDIDVIMPLPFVCYPNAKGQYGRYISEEDQEILFGAIADVFPKDLKIITDILKDKYLYNYNMFVAKEEVYNEYCRWMFPILGRAEELRNIVKPNVQDRFAGYFGEVLTSAFFIMNKDRFKIIHAEKKWYI